MPGEMVNLNMRCEKCDGKALIRRIRADGKDVNVLQCTRCKHWLYLNCAICKEPIKDVRNECWLSGYVSAGDYAHLTCVFKKDKKYDVIASMVHDAYCKGMSKIGEHVFPWYALPEDTKQEAIKNVVAIEEYFLRWRDGYARACDMEDNDAN